jgi:hypothetical protein
VTRLLVVAAALASAIAQAEPIKVGFLGDVALGASVPLGDSDYRHYADPSFKIGFRAGVELAVMRRLHVVPEFALDIVPVNTNDNTFQNLGIDARYNRVRALVGARLVVPFSEERSIGSFFARFGLGVDAITGTTTVNLGMLGPLTSSSSSTGFGFEPAVGVDFRLWKILFAGATVGFPIGRHQFSSSAMGIPAANSNPFTAVDLDAMLFAGVRTL